MSLHGGPVEKMWFQSLLEETLREHFEQKHPDGIWGLGFEVQGKEVRVTYRVKKPMGATSWEEKYKRCAHFTLAQLLTLLEVK